MYPIPLSPVRANKSHPRTIPGNKITTIFSFLYVTIVITGRRIRTPMTITTEQMASSFPYSLFAKLL
jgi:hypothetical protein